MFSSISISANSLLRSSVSNLATVFLIYLIFKGFSKGALRLLTEYDWPGNVRELENEVERAIALAGEGAVIQREDLSPKIYEKSSNIELPNALSADTLRGAIDQLESHLIQEALEKYRWNKSEVARQLGISRLGLQKKLDRLGIQPALSN